MRVSLLGALGCALLALSGPLAVSADWHPHATYDASNWLQSFDFWDTKDPTDGFVHFLDANEAQTRNMRAYDQRTKQVYMGVDTSTVNPSGGRASLRLQTKESFNGGLFILDLEHMPSQACGSWPSWWTCGQ